MFINFQPHFVRIRKDKTKKIYPVIAMEIEKVKNKNKEYKVVEKEKKKKFIPPENSIMIDEEDDDDDNEKSKPEIEVMVIWCLIGDSKTGEYNWFESKHLRFIGITRNKIKKPR